MGTTGIYAANNYAINNLNTGVVNIAITEYTLNEEGAEVPYVGERDVLPGMIISRIPYFTATGNDCYIRAKVEWSGVKEEATQFTDEDLHGISEDWIKAGDYYYYKNVVETNESVNFFNSFTIPTSWGDEINPSNVGEWGFSMKVIVDAVQSENFTPDFESGAPWGNIIIKESIHKDGYDVNTFTGTSETDMSILIEDYANIVVDPDDFFTGLKTMVPGDVLTDSIEIRSKQACELYFSTESLVDIDLLQKLPLTVVLTKGGVDTVVYEGTLDSQLNKVSLGDFAENEKATLTFTISMPAELDNEYTLRNASVKWTFEADKAPIPDGPPQTGDSSLLWVSIGLLVFSGIAMIILFVLPIIWKRRERDN
jgi:hypothetical protein